MNKQFSNKKTNINWDSSFISNLKLHCVFLHMLLWRSCFIFAFRVYFMLLSFVFFSDDLWLEITPGAFTFIYIGCCLIRDIEYNVHMKSGEMCTGSKQKREQNLRNYERIYFGYRFLMLFKTDGILRMFVFHLTINIIYAFYMGDILIVSVAISLIYFLHYFKHFSLLFLQRVLHTFFFRTSTAAHRIFLILQCGLCPRLQYLRA